MVADERLLLNHVETGGNNLVARRDFEHVRVEKQLDALSKELKAAIGSDVAVEAEIDESLIGGLVVKVGSRMVDSSIRTKLQNLKFAMKGVG